MSYPIAEWLHPVGEQNPGGEDVRYEPIFDQIRQARVEEDDLPAGDWTRQRKTADYAVVIKLATEILSKRSKDLQVAAWMTEALLKRDGFTGLRAGLELLGSLLDQFWDHLYPEIEDGDMEFRAAPLEWVAQYIESSVRMVPVTAAGHTVFDYRASRMVGYEKDADTYEKKEAREAALKGGQLSAEAVDESMIATPKAWYKRLVADIDGSLAAIDVLDRLGAEKMAGVAPRFTPLRNAVNDVRQAAAPLLAMKLELEPDPIEPEPESASVVEDVSDGGSPTVAATMSATPRSRADAEGRITAAARYLRAQNPVDPAPYLLLRGFRWGELRVQGSTIEPKLLAAPPTELRSNLRGLLLDGQWAKLLDAGEDVMATPFGRGWLDLQRYVLTACHGLGTEYDHVATAIRGALRALLQDLPQLPSLVLMDDTPTANTESQLWLREQALGGEAGNDAMPVSLAPDGRGRGIAERAMERVRAGEPEKAVEMLIRQAAQERSARERFLRRSEAAAIMTDSGREAVAMPILEELVNEINEHGLEKWEAGDVVAHTLGLMYRCMQKLQGDSSTTEQLYLRICRLDPLKAIQIGTRPQ
jgi:type VI secretion system protein ImpA